MQRIGPVALAALLAIVQSPSAPPTKDSSRLEPYAEVLDAYQACRDTEAIERLATLSPQYVDEAAALSDEMSESPVRLLQRNPGVPGSPVIATPVAEAGKWTDTSRRVAAAFLLHTLLARESLTEERRELHARIAYSIFHRLVAWSPPAEAGALAYAIVAVDLQDQGGFAREAYTLSEMPPLYRKELPALLAVESLHHLLSTPMVLPDRSRWIEVENRRWTRAKGWTGAGDGRRPGLDQGIDGWSRELIKVASIGRKENRGRAIALFRQIATSWPDDAEAYLRLAILLLEDGRPSEADAALQAGGRLQKPEFLGYYEALIRGRVAERQGKLDEAVASYDLAASLAPRAQTPVLANARLLFIAGQAARARELLRTRLPQGTSQSEDDDPLWRTPFGQAWRRPQYLRRLNKVVRPCAQ